MTSAEYEGIEDKSWQCYCCRSVNNESFIYHPFNLEVSNRFSPLADIPGDDSVFINNNEEIISPTAVDFAPPSASSPITAGTHIGQAPVVPTKEHTLNNDASQSTENDSDNISIPSPEDRNSIRIGTLNANSIKGKRAELAELLHTTQLDVLIISETKLPSAAEQKASKKTFNSIHPKSSPRTTTGPFTDQGRYMEVGS